MAQEEALLIVAVHDASVMCEVMTEVLAVRGLVAALADWEQRLVSKKEKLDYNKHVISPKDFEKSLSWHLDQ